jgi:glycosyltransferase involved in cell wall biosynthesis
MAPSKFTVVTPCLDSADLLRRTLDSILGQRALRSGRATLEYLVCDGGSTDGTQQLVREVCGDRAILRSEADSGMYDALARGLAQATGDFVSYLNAGDLYDPGAFDVVLDVMDCRRVRWLTGINVAYNERLEVIQASVPFRYRRDLIEKGLYGPVLPFIQQESTFWRRELLETVDLARLARLRYAGDYYLWRCFSREAELTVVESVLGGFVYHRGQRSEAIREYMAELESIRSPHGPLDRLRAQLDAKLWDALPPSWKRRLNPNFVRYDRREERWA